jgi:hypothetical protein
MSTVQRMRNAAVMGVVTAVRRLTLLVSLLNFLLYLFDCLVCMCLYLHPLMYRHECKIVYLHLLCIVHSGVCPVSSGFGICVTNCVDDQDCQKDEKCCQGSCGGLQCKPALPEGTKTFLHTHTHTLSCLHTTQIWVTWPSIEGTNLEKTTCLYGSFSCACSAHQHS